MSQIYKDRSDGPVPPEVATQYVLDDGTAIPAANILNVVGVDSEEDNTFGILTRATPDLGNNALITLTNRITGTATTTDNSTVQEVYSFDMGATPATYLFQVTVVGFDDNVMTPLGAGYSSERVVRTDGATATLISAKEGIVGEEGDMINTLVENTLSGNNLILEVTGLAGKTIRWNALTTYIKVE